VGHRDPHVDRDKLVITGRSSTCSNRFLCAAQLIVLDRRHPDRTSENGIYCTNIPFIGVTFTRFD
jgi:hypothetical protein